MKSLLVENGQLKYENGNFILLNDYEALRQNLKNRLKMFKGEWFLNKDAGIDWLNILGVKDIDLNKLKRLVRREILKEKKVLKVINISLNLDRKKREINIYFECESVFGLIKDSL